jgi:hypothetical protein
MYSRSPFSRSTFSRSCRLCRSWRRRSPSIVGIPMAGAAAAAAVAAAGAGGAQRDVRLPRGCRSFAVLRGEPGTGIFRPGTYAPVRHLLAGREPCCSRRISVRGGPGIWLWPALPASLLWVAVRVSASLLESVSLLSAPPARLSEAVRQLKSKKARLCAGLLSLLRRDCPAGDVKRERRGVRHVETFDRAWKVQAGEPIAGRARSLPQALAFSAEHQRQR